MSLCVEEWRLCEMMGGLDASLGESESGVIVASAPVERSLKAEIKEKQDQDEYLQSVKTKMCEGTNGDFTISAEGLVLCQGRLCVPMNEELRLRILEEAHRSPYSVHPGVTKMYQGLRRHFWWHGMKQDVARYVARCLVCQRVKGENRKPGGLLQPLPIPEWKWEHITMDFVTGLPRGTRGNDTVWVIVDRLTKSAHFLPIKINHPVERLAEKYVREIVRLHGVPVSITSDRDARFTSKLWGNVQEALGTKIKLSTAFHPQTDGQTERVIRILEDMLRACALELSGSWEDHLPLVEFAYNNGYQASIKMAPFEALYGRNCRSPLCWNEGGEESLLGGDMIQQTTEVIEVIRTRLKEAQDRQKSYADNRRRPLEFEVGDFVFLKISPIKSVVRFEKRGKLSPRFIGPFEVLERVGKVAYKLALPPRLSGVHSTFHVSMLRKYVADPTHVLEDEDIDVNEQLETVTEPIKILDRQERKLRNKTIPMVRVLWRHGGVEEETWETEVKMRNDYPELFAGES